MGNCFLEGLVCWRLYIWALPFRAFLGFYWPYVYHHTRKSHGLWVCHIIIHAMDLKQFLDLLSQIKGKGIPNYVSWYKDHRSWLLYIVVALIFGIWNLMHSWISTKMTREGLPSCPCTHPCGETLSRTFALRGRHYASGCLFFMNQHKLAIAIGVNIIILLHPSVSLCNTTPLCESFLG